MPSPLPERAFPTLPFQIIEIAIENLQQEARRQEFTQAEEDELRRFSSALSAIARSQSPRWNGHECADIEVDGKDQLGHTKIEQHRRTAETGESTAVSKNTPSTSDATPAGESCSAPADLPIKPGDDMIAQRKRRLRVAFRLVDVDNNGRLGHSELELCLQVIGVSKKVTDDFVERVDSNEDSIITLEEFIMLCEDPQFREVADKMEDVCLKGLKIQQPQHKCMLRQTSMVRLAWDLIILLALLFLAIALPVNVGFNIDALQPTFDYVFLGVDCFFLADVILNFRTGYYTPDGFEVRDATMVAKRYIKSWLLPDLVAAIPYQYMVGGSLSGLSSLRLLKYSKAARVMSIIKLSKAFKYVGSTGVFNDFKIYLTEIGVIPLIGCAAVVLKTLLICHWLGCFMAFAANGCVEPCEGDDFQLLHQYVASVYWAMTTMSTVGYGDISPSTSWERLYAMLAMIIGGIFYGFVIGHISNLIASDNIRSRRLKEQMDELQAWLDFHDLPRSIRVRIKENYARTLQESAGAQLDESSIMSNLSPELQAYVGDLVVNPEVRNHPLFQHLPRGVISRWVRILQAITAEKGEQVVVNGEIGYAMFILVDGVVAKGPSASGAQQPISLTCGESFGDEILCGWKQQYEYTVWAKCNTSMQSIATAAFAREFAMFPSVLSQIRENYRRASAAPVEHVGPQPALTGTRLERKLSRVLR